ncbi:MAG: TerB family tellurite resistance protein [Gloeomargarita sp. HHBFW_bins_162]
MRYVWERLRQPVPTALTLDRQESLTALATAIIAIDDEVLPVELAQLATQLTSAGVDLDPHLLAQVEQWLREVDPLELFWAGVQGLAPQDREMALKIVAKLAIADGETLIEENDLVAILGETLGFSYQDTCLLVQQATEI